MSPPSAFRITMALRLEGLETLDALENLGFSIGDIGGARWRVLATDIVLAQTMSLGEGPRWRYWWMPTNADEAVQKSRGAAVLRLVTLDSPVWRDNLFGEALDLYRTLTGTKGLCEHRYGATDSTWKGLTLRCPSCGQTWTLP